MSVREDDEDMTMDEILASIRKYVTDAPSDLQNSKPIYKGDMSESTVVPPAGHQDSFSHRKIVSLTPGSPSIRGDTFKEDDVLDLIDPLEMPSSRIPLQSQPQLFPNPSHLQNMDRGVTEQSPNQNFFHTKHERSPDVKPEPHHSHSLSQTAALYTSSLSPVSSVSPLHPSEAVQQNASPYLTTVPAQKETHMYYRSETHQIAEDDQRSLTSSETLARTTAAFSKLQTSLTPEKVSGHSVLTIDEMIREIARPLVKQWIDEKLPHIVEEMVQKEIQRITRHLP